MANNDDPHRLSIDASTSVNSYFGAFVREDVSEKSRIIAW